MITETAGGTADWNFGARIQLFRRGQEIERYELGADVIERAGYKKIAARSNQLYTIAFRFNNDDFEDGAVTLGFSDLKDGRQFTVAAADNWADVTISLTALASRRRARSVWTRDRDGCLPPAEVERREARPSTKSAATSAPLNPRASCPLGLVGANAAGYPSFSWLMP